MSDGGNHIFIISRFSVFEKIKIIEDEENFIINVIDVNNIQYDRVFYLHWPKKGL